ncbi:hypothetical protein [Rhizobium leguminosarum]|uniref:hypothetical protein n=1 Tax=Rhizobium leguminosarum TaxID=384 RepID=UPI001427ED07|nr:hypothetical protein [Rhizobium leguminosarum]
MLWLVGIPIPIIILLYFFTPSKTHHGGLDLKRKRRGPQPPKPMPDAWSADHPSFVFLKIEEFLHCRNQVPAFRHFHRPDKLAGRRSMPLDLNFPEGVQIFDMAFAERVSMALIPSGQVLNRA